MRLYGRDFAKQFAEKKDVSRLTKLSSNKLIRKCQIKTHMIEVKKAHKERR